MKKRYFFLVSILIICIDQLSKYYILKNLIPYYPLYIFPGLNFTLVFNTGSAFSFLSDSGDWHRWFFMIFSALMSIIIIYWMQRTSTVAKKRLLGLALILGGALGNLIDRVYLGHVVDFIDVYYKTYHWPVFNIADSAITIGAILLFFSLN